MIRGLYNACSGMMVQMARQDVLANNLANVNTAGFKKDIALSAAFPQMLLQRIGEVSENNGTRTPVSPVSIGSLGIGATISQIATDHSVGMFKATENQTDFALKGDGFFTIETPDGLKYTRNGSFSLTAEGRLVTSDGFPVMGLNGYIETNGSLSVDEKGNIEVNGNDTETFKIVTFEDKAALTKVGSSLFEAGDQQGQVDENPRIMQNYIEASNVNPVQEMVDLITVVRAYEMSQKMIQAEDQTLDKAVNTIGGF